MRRKFQCDKNAGTLTLNDMIHYTSNCAAADDDAGGTMPAMLPSHKKNNNNNNNGKQKNPSADQQAGGSDNMVAMTFQRGSQGGGRGRGRSSGADRGQQCLKQHKLPEPALPCPTRSTETCLAWHKLIRK